MKMQRMLLAALLLAGALAAAEPRLEGFASRADWAVAPGGSDEVTLEVKSADGAWKGTAELEVCNAEGKREQVATRPCEVAAGAVAVVKFPVTFSGEIGERLLRARLYEGSAQDPRVRVAEERSLMVAGPDCAFIVFNQEPTARGMDFVRERCAAKEIVSRGYRRWVWEPHYGSHEQGWWRTLRMNLDDPAFLKGSAPVVDVVVRYRQPAEAPVSLSADCEEGGGACVRGWGGRGEGYVKDPPVKEMYAKIDDAVFASTIRDSRQPGDTSGCDLRFNTCNAGEIRSILVRRYAMKDNVDWKRMLRHTGVAVAAAGKDVENFVVAPGAPATVRLKFANRAAVPFAGKAKVTLRTAYDAPLWERELDVKLKPRGEDALAVPVATKGLRKGVYVLRAVIGDLAKTETLFAVCDSDPIPFAKEGDFLYGSGVGGKWTDGYRLDWARFMGVDLVRNCERGEGQDNRENLNAAIAELKKRGFPCGHLIMDPPYRPDAAERRKLVEKAGDFLRWAAAEHRDFLRFIEIGNEPDLPFFYAGSTDEYVEGMAALAKAAKEGNPQAVVMNGGLCFHGADGWRRAHEIVGKTPDGLLGAWAYHGHGPGAAAERNAWNRQQKALKDANKKLLPCIETESGMFANDPVTWRRQAQTAVEKIVFAQSVGAPTFLWFAIYMYGGDWGYTSVEREHEPRPAVLAYRTMTKHLKGLRFVKTLDLLAPEAEAYCFAAPDGRRALVLWSDRGEITRAVSLGEDAAATVSDLYDNREKAVAVAPGLLQLTIGADPTFVAWTSKDKDAAVSLPKPPLAAPAELPLVPGKDATLAVTVRNPTDAELRGELKLSRMGAAPISFAAPTLPVAVPARGEKRVEVKVQTADAVPSFWPRQWRVFLPVDGEVDLASFKAVPDSVEGRKGKVAGRACVAPGGALDFGALNGGFAEKKQALCFAEIDSPRDLEAEFGAAADWWMQWFVNGKEVYSTMDRGNGGPQSLLTHRFKVKLRQGRNLVAARVLSGSGGWRLVAGGPDEVAAAERERAGRRDGARVELVVAGKALGREAVPTRLLRPLDRAPAGVGKAPASWDALAPDFVIEDNVVNLFVAVPDATKHWHGADDFSGRAWLRDVGDRMLVLVKVRDDVAKPGDGVTVKVAPEGRVAQAKEYVAKGRRDESAKATVYVVEVPKADLGGGRFAVSLSVSDDDWGEPKQRATWGAAADGSDWHQAWSR